MDEYEAVVDKTNAIMQEVSILDRQYDSIQHKLSDYNTRLDILIARSEDL